MNDSTDSLMQEAWKQDGPTMERLTRRQVLDTSCIIEERNHMQKSLETLERFMDTDEYRSAEDGLKELLAVSREYCRRLVDTLDLRTVWAVSHKGRTK